MTAESGAFHVLFAALTPEQQLQVVQGGVPGRGNEARLKKWWLTESGIHWGIGGDYDQCVAMATKIFGEHAVPIDPHRWCEALHQEATGAPPGHAPGETHAGGTRMAEIRDVEIARVGEWSLASGPLTVTPQMLVDAAEYANRAGAAPGYLKIGHTDPRFTGDGEPSLGWLQNLRVEGSGDDSVLVGDIVDMPEWLAEAAPKHWPNRSMEGWTDKVEGGKTYSMVVDGLSLLGVTPPGMSSLRSLRDLPQALGVAASARIVATITAASTTPWSQFSDSDYSDEQYAKACVLDRGPDAGTAKERYGLRVREPSGALNVNGVHAAAQRIGSVKGATAEQKQAAARKLISLYGQLNEQPPDSLRSIAASDLPTASADGPNNTEGGSAVAFSDEQITNLRAKLQLPETADEAAIMAAVEAVVDENLEHATPPATPTADPATPPAPQTTATPPAEPAVQPVAAGGPGTMVIDAAAWEAREEDIRRLKAAEAKRRTEERDEVIAQAVSAGKFPPARRELWQRQWDANPEGTRQLIAALQPNVVPTQLMGEMGEDDDTVDEEFAHLFPPTASKGV